jgi:hypothetical protein
VRRSPPKYCYLVLPLDLHVLSLPLAFILSQDQTLHCKNYSICTYEDRSGCSHFKILTSNSREIALSRLVCYFILFKELFSAPGLHHEDRLFFQSFIFFWDDKVNTSSLPIQNFIPIFYGFFVPVSPLFHTCHPFQSTSLISKAGANV